MFYHNCRRCLHRQKKGVEKEDLNSWMKDKVKMPNDHQLRDGPQHSSNCEIFWHIMPMVMTMFMMTGRIPGPVQDNAGEVFIIGLFTTAPLISGHCTWWTRPVRCILITTRHCSIFVQKCTKFKNIWSLCTHYYIMTIIFVIINWPEYERWQSRERHARRVQAEYTHDQPLVVRVLIAYTHYLAIPCNTLQYLYDQPHCGQCLNCAHCLAQVSVLLLHAQHSIFWYVRRAEYFYDQAMWPVS